MKATESIEKIIEFLNKQNIEATYEEGAPGVFNRVVEFEVEGRIYFIEWWKNQCYFKLENTFSSPKLPFKYINVNPYSPTTVHSLELCFYDVEQEINRIPFGSFKIPFNNENNNTN